jgi:hypothetical protein
VSLLCGVARATPPIELDWRAPPSCPGPAEVLARVDRHRDPAVVARVPLHASAVVDGDDARGWTLALATRQGDALGDRSLAGASCDELADAAALILALSLRDEPETSAGASPPRPPVTPPVVSPARAPWRFSARLAGGANAGLVPGVSLAPTLALTLTRGGWRAELTGAWVFAARAVSPSGAGAMLGAWGVGVRGCAVPLAGAVEVDVCAASTAGAMYGESFAVSAPAAGETLWWGVGARVSAALRVGEFFALRAGADGSVLLLRPEVSIDGVGIVHRASPLVTDVWAGAEVGW